MNEAIETTIATVQPPDNTPLLPINLIEKAIASGADLANIEKLMDLQERWEKTQAKKAFYGALTLFQRNCPVIEKRKAGYDNRYTYAPLSDIQAQIRELLFRCGLSIRFEQNHESGITVTCLVSHVDGHSESTTMTGIVDKSGSKNDIQAVGSTVSYLQRYTLISALGITTADTDMDGRLPDEFRQINEEHAAKLIADAEESASKGVDSFRTFWESLTLREQTTIGLEEKKRLYNNAKAVKNVAKN